MKKLSKIIFRFSQQQNKEQIMKDKLVQQLKATEAKILDTSGGCGQMYQIVVESELFKGKTKIEQHRMVNDVLQEDLKGSHGFNLKTIIKK